MSGRGGSPNRPARNGLCGNRISMVFGRVRSPSGPSTLLALNLRPHRKSRSARRSDPPTHLRRHRSEMRPAFHVKTVVLESRPSSGCTMRKGGPRAARRERSFGCYTTSAWVPFLLTNPRSLPSMNASRSPSRTAWMLLVSTPVRWSLII
jgi:hypothetical protein